MIEIRTYSRYSKVVAPLGVILFALLYSRAARSVCTRFYYVPGYDTCSIPATYIFSAFFFLAMSIGLLLPRKQAPSSVVIWTIYLMHVFGAIALYPYYSSDVGINSLIFIIFLMTTFIISAWVISNVSARLKYIIISRSLFYIIMTIIGIIPIIIIVSAFGINFDFASIFDVYDVREKFKEALSFIDGRATAYAMLLTGFLFSPLLTIFGIYSIKHNPIWGCVMLLIGIFSASQIFAAAAFKSVAAIAALAVIMPFFIRDALRPFQAFLVFLMLCIIGLFTLQALGLNSSAVDHWFRRAFIAPGMNVIYYQEYFGLFNVGSAEAAPLTISLEYYGTSGSANSGVYGNGLAMAGIVGVMFNLSILIGFCILLDGVTEYVPASISFPMAFTIGYAFSNSATTTVMVSYGGVAMIIIFYLLSGSRKRYVQGGSI